MLSKIKYAFLSVILKMIRAILKIFGDDPEDAEDADIPMSLMARKATGIFPKSDAVAPVPLNARDIRTLREHMGLSPNDFADFTGADNGETVLAWENGTALPNSLSMSMLLEARASNISYKKS